MPALQYNIVANSTFLDAFGAMAVGPGDPAPAIRILANNTATDVAAFETARAVLNPLLGYPGSPASLQWASSTDIVNVALTLERAAPQSTLDALLNGDWADRQGTIAAQGSAIWSTFGADPATYAATQQAILAALDIPPGQTSNPMTLAAEQGYSASAENRTIWLSLSPAQFGTLFNSLLIADDASYAWTGPLSLPTTIAPGSIAGLWVDQGRLPLNPVIAASVPSRLPHPDSGPVSLGNWAAVYEGERWAHDIERVDAAVTATPAALAAYYDFPLPIELSVPNIGLIETGLELPGLLEALNRYRHDLGLRALREDEFRSFGATTVPTPGGDQLELALDVSVISGAAPNSAIWLYGAQGQNTLVTDFQAFQNAFFAGPGKPGILSSSWNYFTSMTAQSPFQRAWQDLFVDGMLAGVSVHIAIGDQGSNGFQPNGTGNLPAGTVPAYALAVGGTSIASPWSASHDVTLDTLYGLAMADDPATVFALVAAGLTTLPSTLSTADPQTLTAGAHRQPYAGQLSQLIEAVWNEYLFTRDGRRDLYVAYGDNDAGSGGVDQTQPVPSYQSAVGLTPGATPASPNGAGRGAPDVSALAGGDAYYAVLNNEHIGDPSQPVVTGDIGTSAAAPLWATLTSQFNVVFADQGLPSLGFYNDLLYIAAAIAPASFNDIVLGNNRSGFFYTADNSGYVGYYNHYVQPTDVGYEAGPGYDLATGLGTPNGLLLARALAQIAHEQMYFDTVDPFLAADGPTAWRAGATESLLIQASATREAHVHLSLGAAGTTFSTGESAEFAWTARLAQQSLQADFDPALVTMFDGQAQGTLRQETLGDDTLVTVTIDGRPTVTPQAGISTPFGFADFTTKADAAGFDPDVRVALPVAIAETAGGADDTVAIVRLRQNGTDNLAVTFFRVDDQAGAIAIDGRVYRPGDASYGEAALERAYVTQGGATTIDGPGYGQFAQAGLADVDAGDIIAMMLSNETSGASFFSFARANEKVNGQDVAHLWNYGLNTWGFEDTWAGGDRDYNDLVIGLDFVSAAGQGYLL